MQRNSTTHTSPWLVWVYPVDILSTFNAAPRLEITKEMRKLGWKVDLVSSGSRGKHMFQGVEVLCFPRPNVYLIRQMIFHLRVIGYVLQNWNSINVILFTEMSTLWIMPLRLLCIFSKKHPLFVVDIRTVPMESANKATLKDKLRGQLSLAMSRLSNWLADGQTAITQRMADLLDIPHEKLWGTWPSGVNVEKFSGTINERQWPAPEDPIVITYIGTLHYERNLMALCEAVVRANQDGMNFELLLYGEGTEKDDLQAFANQHPDAIRVHNSVPHDQVPGILARAHVGALPFPDEEKYRVSSPIKLFEYMGAGMPILATHIVCHTDVIGTGEYVFWAEDAGVNGLLDALQRIWSARLALPAMGEKSLSAASNWTYEASAGRLHKALQHGFSLYYSG